MQLIFALQQSVASDPVITPADLGLSPGLVVTGALISALIIGEGVLLDDAMRRLARERMLKEVLRSVNETLAKERGELEESLERIRLLSGLLPICSSCKRIRDDEGSWRQIEEYIGAHSEATFTHGICPECARRLYPRSFEDDIA